VDTISFTSDRFPTKDPSRSFTDISVVKVEGLQSRLAEETLAVEERSRSGSSMDRQMLDL
jgi:hypothetical protein